MSSDSIAVGIDLGTTYSCVAAYIDGEVIIIPNELGKKTTPSCVAFDEDGSILVGEVAKPPRWPDPESSIFDAKRLIGRSFSDPIVQKDIKIWPFKVVPSERDIPKICVHDKTYFAEEISARILLHMKKIAETHLNKAIKNVVITVPAYFNNGQRQATKDAGEIAGLNVLKIINEPTAAAIAYYSQGKDKTKKNVLVFDLGGGTFDVAIVTMSIGDIQVKAIAGDTHLGGQDFDNELVNYCLEVFKKKHGENVVGNANAASARAISRIRNECEQQKMILSSAPKTRICLDAVYKGLDLVAPVTRAQFEDFAKVSFEKCIKIVTDILKDANLKHEDVDDIVLVGGSSRIPKIQEMLTNLFGGKPLIKTLNPDEAVAYGAAVQASILNGNGKQAGPVASKLSSSDVTPLSIGIENASGELIIMIPKNTVIPCNANKNWICSEDYQTEIYFPIYEGQERIAKDNHLLGKFTLENIPKARKGVEKVVTKMEIDDEGILHVSATVESNRSYNSITISALQGQLTKAQIDGLKLRNVKEGRKDERTSPGSHEDSNSDWETESSSNNESDWETDGSD